MKKKKTGTIISEMAERPIFEHLSSYILGNKQNLSEMIEIMRLIIFI